jgi:multidrug efflux system membrane fusion protein
VPAVSSLTVIYFQLKIDSTIGNKMKPNRGLAGEDDRLDPPYLRRIILVAAAAVMFAAVSGCSEEARSKPPAAPSAPEVTVAEVICKQLDDADEFTGRLEAVHVVEVRPRISGFLQKVNFKEGALVRQGDVLFEIDPRPMQAEVDKLKGDLAEAKSELARAESDFQRAERLHNNNGMSIEEYDRRAAQKNTAGARIASIEAALRGAQLNLDFTRVTAPITGRVGRAEITEGNLVQAGPDQQHPLTTLVSLDPIYVYFDVDEQTYLKYARVTRAAGATSKNVGHNLGNEARLGLVDERNFPHAGRVNFVDNQVSSTTGTIRLRATFPNLNFALTPGLFGRIRLQGGGSYRGCLAKDEAVVTDLSQKYVFVLGKDNTLQYRPVKLGPITEGLRVVREGLKEGDVIVVNGLQRVRPGAAVSPKKVPMVDAGSGDSSAETAPQAGEQKPPEAKAKK